jgi:hypothetical protein
LDFWRDPFDELTAGAFDELTAGAFDELTAGAFDELTAGAFDELATGAFDELATGRLRSVRHKASQPVPPAADESLNLAAPTRDLWGIRG